MPRPKGSKNKPKGLSQEDVTRMVIAEASKVVPKFENLPDFMKPAEVAVWRRTSRARIMKMIYEKEIPEDCYDKNGNRYLLKKHKLALLFGIRDIGENPAHGYTPKAG